MRRSGRGAWRSAKDPLANSRIARLNHSVQGESRRRANPGVIDPAGVDAMVSSEIIQGPTPQNQERSRRRFGDRRGRGEHGDLRAPPERLSAPGIDDVAQHRRSEPRRLTPRSRRRACLFVERELAGEATFGMAQDDTPSPSGRVPDRDETRLSEVEDGGSAATTPEASHDAVQSDPLADGAEVDR